jgi:DNA-binding transcriptional ArsR family regulator
VLLRYAVQRELSPRASANRLTSPVDSAFVAPRGPKTGPVSTLTSRRIPHPPVEHPQLVPYAPIIQRTNEEIQVGVDPDAALVFRGERIGALLTLLNGSRPISAVRRAARAAGLTKPQVTWALDALDAAGLLTERGAVAYTAALIPLRVRLIGAGPVGSQIARVLVASGLGTLYVYDNEPTDVALYPAAGLLTSRAEALRSALAEADSTISTLSHWSKPEAALDLTIVACDSPELDRVITDHLLRIDEPHLVVRCWGNGVSVGPLVLAGQTSCVRCADLARSDADPQWPVVLTQLSRLRLESPPALLAWAASVATAQALAFLHGELPESAGTTLELSWPDFVTRLRRWPAHPGCGCGWLSHTE